MYNAYIRVGTPAGKRPIGKRGLERIAFDEAPGILGHAHVATHLGRPVFRIEERWAESFRTSYAKTINALKACGYTPIVEMTRASEKAWRSRP